MRLYFWKQPNKNRERSQFVRCMSILDFFILSNCLTYQHWFLYNFILDFAYREFRKKATFIILQKGVRQRSQKCRVYAVSDRYSMIS